MDSTPVQEDLAKVIEERLKEREADVLTSPYTCDAAYIYHPMGASLEEIEPFTKELTTMVDKMKEDLVKETRILDGTEAPTYKENELSTTQD